MKVINLFGGPGSGKSTQAAGLFYHMKMNHVNVELVTEYAKDLVWSDRIDRMLDQQEYIFAKQHHKLHRLKGQVDYAIIDSPLLLSIAYSNINIPEWDALEPFHTMVKTVFESYDNINFFLKRPSVYQTEGRYQGYEDLELVDNEILKLFDAPETGGDSRGYVYHPVKVAPHTVEEMYAIVRRHEI